MRASTSSSEMVSAAHLVAGDAVPQAAAASGLASVESPVGLAPVDWV